MIAVAISPQEILAIPIVGVAVNAIVQVAKPYMKGTYATLLSIALCVALGTAYSLFSHASWLPAVVGSLGVASTVWNIVIEPLEKKMKEEE